MTEQAQYTVVRADGPFELRDYPTHIVAETVVGGGTRYCCRWGEGGPIRLADRIITPRVMIGRAWLAASRWWKIPASAAHIPLPMFTLQAQWKYRSPSHVYAPSEEQAWHQQR